MLLPISYAVGYSKRELPVIYIVLSIIYLPSFLRHLRSLQTIATTPTPPKKRAYSPQHNEQTTHTQHTIVVRSSGVRRKCSWGFSISGIWWSFVFGARCLWRHNHVSKPSLLTQYTNSSTRTLVILCHCTENKPPALEVRISEENTLKATTQQFITAKMSSCALKQGTETHSSILRQSYILGTASERFTTAKSGCANVSSNTSNRE